MGNHSNHKVSGLHIAWTIWGQTAVHPVHHDSGLPKYPRRSSFRIRQKLGGCCIVHNKDTQLWIVLSSIRCVTLDRKSENQELQKNLC